MLCYSIVCRIMLYYVTCTNGRMCVPRYIHMYMHICAPTHTYVYIHIYIYIYIYVYIYVCINICTICIGTCMSLSLSTYIYIYTCICICICICICMRIYGLRYPRFKERLRSNLGSWSLGSPRCNLYRLYRFVPGPMRVSKIQHPICPICCCLKRTKI